jgi:hypothetical protein
MKFHEMYPQDRIYAADFGGKAVTLTIKAVENELLGKGSQSEKTLPVWHFEETPKKFPAVKTNGLCARAMFGDDSDDWIGHKITLYPAKDESGLSDDGLCIRVKGSPELERPLEFRAQLGRSKKTFRLVPTKKKAAGATQEPAGDVSGSSEGEDSGEAADAQFLAESDIPFGEDE